MRGVAAIAVMLGHFSEHASTPFFQNARLAPDLFFCLSGFVLAFSYQQRLQDGAYFATFLRRRLVRLYPMFLMGFGLGVCALGLKMGYGETTLSPLHAVAAVVLNAFYLPYLGHFIIVFGKDRFPSAIFPVNDPSWSLFFELLVNIVFAAWAWFGGKFGRLIVVVSGLCLFAYIFTTREIEPGWGFDNIIGGLPRTAYGFFAGVCLHAVYPRLKAILPRLASIGLVIFPIVLFGIPDIPHETIFYLGAVLFVVPPLVALGAVSQSDHAVTRRILDYLGWISYPLYCLHFPIYSMVTTIRGSAESPFWLVLALSAVSWAVSHSAARWIDEPVRLWLTQTLFARKVGTVTSSQV